MKTTKLLALTCCIPLAIGLSGCQMMQPTQPPQPTTHTVSYKLPALTPVDPTKQTQETDGVRITVSPYTYSAKELFRPEVRPIPSIFVINNERPANLFEIPYIELAPKDVRFKVSVYNHLNRVLRLAGTAVAFEVAGKTMATDKAGYDDFLNGMILPQQEGDYEIAGPDISTLPDDATIGLFLYDMVTATDAAGNPTKRSNLEFYYTLSRQDKTQDLTVSVKRVMLDPQGRIVGRP